MNDKFILLVEDNPDDEALMLRALQKQGGARRRVVVVHDGVEALEYLLGLGVRQSREARPMPALIVLDLKLPKIDGLEVLARLKGDKRTRSLPVVILTSSREEQDLRLSYQLGVNSYLLKPVDFNRFSDLVNLLGRYWMDLNEPPPGGLP